MATFTTSNYVKFVRGTSEAWNALETKNRDTLYFISDDETSGKLYLGEKLICGGDIEISISQVSDFLISEGVSGNDILIFDVIKNKWVNKPIADILTEGGVIGSNFTGATSKEDGEAGLVPAPTKNDVNLFLKGDGTWANPIVENEEILMQKIEDAKDEVKEYTDAAIQKAVEEQVPAIAADQTKAILEDALNAAISVVKNSQGSSTPGSGSGSGSGAGSNSGSSACNCGINELKQSVANLETRVTKVEQQLEWKDVE